jgi:hypothetical protein
MINADLVRTTINERVGVIKRFIRWAERSTARVTSPAEGGD